jgi:DNA polymerase-1
MSNDYKIIRFVEELEDYIGDVSEIAFDFETSPTTEWRHEPTAALDPHKSDITGVSVSVKEGTARYIPLRHRNGKNADIKAMTTALTRLIYANRAAIKIAHNLAFETQFVYKNRTVIVPPVYDTMAAAQLTLKNEYEFRELSDSGLKTLVPHLYHEDLPKFAEVAGERFFDELDPDDAETVRYACADSDYALRLKHTFNDWFEKYLPKHRYIVEELESLTAVYTGLMKYNGVLADTELMSVKREIAAAKVEELRGAIGFIIGDVDLGANAGTQAFKDYLFKDLRLPVLKSTKKYKEAADDETMQLLADYCCENRPELAELFELVTDYRKWGKTLSTYIDGYTACVNNATGRIHPDLMPLGADSGRFACRKPNLQNTSLNLPVNVREFMTAPPDVSLVELDYAQIEARLAAYLSGDEALRKVFLDGLDMHAMTTAGVFKITYEEATDKNNPKYKKRRTTAKTTFFGYLYGIYAKSLQRNLKNAGVESGIEECKLFLDNLSGRYATLAQWQKAMVKDAKAKRYAETKLGRRRYFPYINSIDFGLRGNQERGALNHNVQGLAADLLKLSMARLVNLIAENNWIQPVLTVHDSLVFYVPGDRVAEAVALIKAEMECDLPVEGFDIPILAEASVGANYGRLKEVG